MFQSKVKSRTNTTDAASDPARGYRRLAAAVLWQGCVDAHAGNADAIEWIGGDSPWRYGPAVVDAEWTYGATDRPD